MKVFLDTNALIRDPSLIGPHWPAAAAAISGRVIEVLVPEIAVAETVQHLSEVLEEHRGSLAKLNRERQQYGLAPVLSSKAVEAETKLGRG